MDEIDLINANYKNKLVLFNVCNLTAGALLNFQDYYSRATKSGVDPIKAVRVWNSYAISVREHVFIEDRGEKI